MLGSKSVMTHWASLFYTVFQTKWSEQLLWKCNSKQLLERFGVLHSVAYVEGCRYMQKCCLLQTLRKQRGSPIVAWALFRRPTKLLDIL